MKIAQVAPFFHPHIGGVESHVLTLSEMLVKNGHDVTVFTSRYEDLKEDDVFNNVKIVRVKQVANLFSTPITPGLKRAFDQKDFDVIHAHTPPPLSAYYAARAVKRTGCPFVVTYHCDLELPRLMGKIATAVYRRTLSRYTFGRAKKIIVHTKTYGATSRTIWKYDVAVIPSAVNPERFTKELDCSDIIKRHSLEGKKVILFVGRIVAHKGVDYLIDSLSLMPENVRLIIVGSGEYTSDLRNRARDKKVDKKVIFAGKVSHKDLPKYFSCCDVFVLPSISRLEAFGLVILEAMASSKPVVISNIPGVTELVVEGEEGLHAEPMNAQDLAKKIGMLLSDDKLRIRMGEAGRSKVEREFSWDRVTSQIEDVYQKMI